MFKIFGQQQTFTQSLLGSGQQNFSQLNSQMHAQSSDNNDINAASNNQLTNENQFNPLNNQVNSQVATQLNTQIGGFNQNQFSMQVIILILNFDSMPPVSIFQTFKTSELLNYGSVLNSYVTYCEVLQYTINFLLSLNFYFSLKISYCGFFSKQNQSLQGNLDINNLQATFSSQGVTSLTTSLPSTSMQNILPTRSVYTTCYVEHDMHVFLKMFNPVFVISSFHTFIHSFYMFMNLNIVLIFMYRENLLCKLFLLLVSCKI